MEILWTGITAAIFITVALLGQRVWWNLHMVEAPAGAAQVHVLAQQFQWNFHYAGPDGTVRPHRPAEDQRRVDQLHRPRLRRPGREGRRRHADASSRRSTAPVELTLTARDVTHSFWVPQLRFKQDAVPGLDVKVHFTPQQVGQYEIACAELCGQQHYKMRSFMLVAPRGGVRRAGRDAAGAVQQARGAS